MREDLVPTAIVLKELNCESVKTLQDRILLQKKIFILQEVGIDLGFSFSWYLHGPYSPELTCNAFEISTSDLEVEYELPETTRIALERVNSLPYLFPDFKGSAVSLYELLASVIFWIKEKGADNSQCVTTILKYKPHFTSQQILDAITGLETHQLIRA